MELSFIVQGKVQAKQSARFCKIGNYIKSYQSQNVIDYANWVKQCFLMSYPEHKAEVFKDKMLAIKTVAYFEIPKSKPKKFQEQAREGLIRPITKPDTDNIGKNIKDALNKIAFPDDSQIVTEIIEKRYSDTPRAEIFIREVELYQPI